MTDAVGIIGAGRLGQAMARTARRAGRDVVIANSPGELRDPWLTYPHRPRRRRRSRSN
jgi:predicted dinucleotide-binding enzyme